MRDQWVALASRYDAAFRAIHCICSDERLHRTRIEGRQRGIPGWYELTWQHVVDSSARFENWKEEHIVCDSVESLESNSSKVDQYICG